MKQNVVRLSLIIGLLASALTITHAHALTTWTVTKTADTDDETCDADCSLREAIFVATDGDTIDFNLTLPTTITLNSPLIIQKSLTFDGPGTGELTISGGGLVNPLFLVFYNATPYSVTINDLTLANASGASDGGAINSYGNLTVDNVRFEDNTLTAAKGAGIYMNTDSSIGSPLTLTVTNSVFDTNTGIYAGAIFSVDSNVTIKNSSFYGNNHNALNTNSAFKDTTFILANSTFMGNSTNSVGGAIYVVSSGGFSVTASINNVTFAGNTASTSGSSLHYSGATNMTVKNTIFADNAGSNCSKSGIAVAAGSANLSTDTTCNALGITTTQKTLAEIGLDTLVTSPTYYYPLTLDSDALEAGDAPTCADAGSVNNVDQIGTTRPQAGACDIGAIEFLYMRHFAVPSGGMTSGVCESWANACTLPYALSVADAGHQVWVRDGNYTPDVSDRSVSFELESGVEIYGGFAGNETLLIERDPSANQTILDGDLSGDDAGSSNKGDNSYHVVHNNGADNTALLDGFIIRNGYATTDNDLITSLTSENGGGFFNESGSPVLRDIKFQSNFAEYGGGIASFGGDPTIENASFVSNQALGDGGAISLLSSDPIITNVTMYQNTSGVRGGAMHIQSSSDPLLTNVTMAANSTDGNGGSISLDDSSNPVATNSILWNNSAAIADPEVYNAPASSSTLTVTYSTVTGGYAGTGNLSTDPLLGSLTNHGGFVDTVDLLSGSPAIDRGTNTGCPAADARGVARPINGNAIPGAVCDMGAYEASAYTAIQRIINGGFNTYTGTGKIPKNWKKNPAFTTATDGKTTAFKKEGTASVTIIGAPARIKTLSQNIALNGYAGDAFTLSFWSKGNALPTAGLCQVQVLFYNGGSLVATKTLKCPKAPTYNWKKVSLPFSAPVNYTNVTVKITYSKASGTVLFDLASLIR